jgi:drug/metabolite transporter (DMT)-like permease
VTAGGTAGGIALAVAAAAAFETSYVMQAVEARRADDGRPASARVLARLVRRPLWLGAIALSVGAVALQVLALRLAPLSLVQPVLALGVVLLLVLGRVVLGDRAGPRELLGAVGVVAGVCLLVLAAPERGGSGSGLALAIACVVLGLLTLAPYVLHAQRAFPLIAAAACADGLAALALNEVAGALTPFALVALAWAALAALAGILGLASESSALQRATVGRVGPSVLAGQIAIPVALAPLVAGDRWGDPALVIAGLVLTLASTTLLASSPGVERIRQS